MTNDFYHGYDEEMKELIMKRTTFKIGQIISIYKVCPKGAIVLEDKARLIKNLGNDKWYITFPQSDDTSYVHIRDVMLGRTRLLNGVFC